MLLEKFNRQLKLMTLLAGNTSLTLAQISERMGLSPRTIYRYIQMMKESSYFKVEQSGDIFRLSKDSPFLKDISDNVSFSEDEAIIIARLIDSVGGNSIQIRNLRTKLERIYDYRLLATPEANGRIAQNLSRLYEAVKQHRVVVLKNYHSLNSENITNRIVEPYMFFNSNDDIRCFEYSSGINKTFKVARIEEVVLLDLTWSNTGKHEYNPTDLFGFTDKVIDHVVLKLTLSASKILQEENPDATNYITPSDDGKFILDADICNYYGVSRFILGLYSEVEILGSDKFKEYIRQETKLLTQKFNP